ncbi:MAG: IS1182 family transposase [bacterium]|nr:IS1182 family transposase [bacterium]
MSGFRRPEQKREQMVLWEQRLDDAVPQDHPVRQVDFLLHSAAFAETFARWERDYVLLEGKPPYHPRDLSALYLYGMMNRIRSSRQLEAACYNRVDVIWLLQGQHPDHSTVADFVGKHGQRLGQLFRDVLRVAVEAQLVKLEHVAVDGTKIEADAGKSSVHREGTIRTSLADLDARIAALEQEWAANEQREASLFGDQAPWKPEVSGSSRQRLARMKRQQERLKKSLAAIERRREESSFSRQAPKAIASVTDPGSRIMPDKEGKRKPNYNTQLAVDAERGVIVAQDTSDATDDSGQLTPMLEQVDSNCGRWPAEASADSQYNTGPELARLEDTGVVGYLPDAGTRSEEKDGRSEAERALGKVPGGESLSDSEWSALPRDTRKFISRVAFVYDTATDSYRCPAGHRLSYVQGSQDRKKWGIAKRRHYGGCPSCASCPQGSQCCQDPSKGRTVTRDQYESYRERLRSRMSADRGRERYRLRRRTVEPRIGQIKQVLGLRRFLRRGLEAVRTEWSLACTAVNLGILLRHWEEVVAVL